ncbi:MAG TPA: M13 family metallopeptidase [Chitinophagaceae bacterium]|nr:M13 family metallopeptidase [Chitinophagaceae bacterium]
MKKLLSPAAMLLLLVTIAFSCKEQSAATTAGTKKFLDSSTMDPAVKPGDNFFNYVNGGWVKRTTIPPTESSAGAVLDMYNRTKEHLHAILDSAAKGGFANGSIEQKVGDFYASGMDSATIDQLGYTPIKPTLQQIDAIKDPAGIMQFVAQQTTEGKDIVIAAGIGPDDKNSTVNIAFLQQTGLGLPDKDYYFNTDPATAGIVKAYQQYITKLFTLTGDDSVSAQKKMMAVYNLEKQMATSHRSNVELRDPQKNYNKMSVAQLNKSMPVIGWSSLFSAIGFKVDSVNVQQPVYYTKINQLLSSVPVDSWKAYLRFHVLDGAANALSSDFVNASFAFSSTLTGRKQLNPRWERMYESTDANLGDPLGELYVKKYFGADAKDRMLELVNNLQTAFEARIKKLDWMSDSTKKVSIDKLHAIIKKIGYPDKWRDYSKVTIDRHKYFENLVACAKDEYQYQLNKLGKPVDKTEWAMTAPTINAYYNPSFNEIVFPAGILQPPYFDPTADDAINYGGIGMVIGHEMTHGFDDQGSQYDKNGNLKTWWSPADYEKFKGKTKMVVDQYNKFTVLDTLHVNGALTTGENIADIGGINIAYDAFKMTKQGQDTTRIDGLTPDQRFFLSFAQGWRSKFKDESVRRRIKGDPHSPAIHRVNGPLMHCPPFYTAFNIQPGDSMYVEEKYRIHIW